MLQATKDNYQDEILRNEGPVLVDFYASWCGPCQVLLRTLENFKTDVKVVKVDIEECEEFAKEMNIMSVPTLILFDNGVELRRRSGKTSSRGLAELVNI